MKNSNSVFSETRLFPTTLPPFMKPIMQPISNTVPLTIFNTDISGKRRGAVSGQDAVSQPQVQHSLLKKLGIQRVSPCRQLDKLHSRLPAGIEGRPRSDAVCFRHHEIKMENEFSIDNFNQPDLPASASASLEALKEDAYGSFDDAIQFIQLVRQFKDNPNRENAQEAFTSCIQTGAKFPVNVPSQIKQNLAQYQLIGEGKKSEAVAADVFDSALVEVLKLLKQGLALTAGQEGRSEQFTRISQNFLMSFKTIDEQNRTRDLKNLSRDGQNDAALRSVEVEIFLQSFDGWDFAGKAKSGRQ